MEEGGEEKEFEKSQVMAGFFILDRALIPMSPLHITKKPSTLPS